MESRVPEGPPVANSGPLIALAMAGRLDLLREICGRVLVPDAVWREVTKSRLR
jgi:predicted nucleic acid-binding protein